VFDNRLSFVEELIRMGADVRHEGRHAVVRGRPRLSGAPVRAFDVRGGRRLALAGMRADGETLIDDWHHVDRGYPDLPAALRSSAPTSTACESPVLGTAARRGDRDSRGPHGARSSMSVSPSARIPARARAAPARTSNARTGAPESRGRPRTTA